MQLSQVFYFIKVILLFSMFNPGHCKSPHIIIILADDLGFDDVSFRGNNDMVTPNIDALAYSGIVLDRLYTASSCTPSRAALLTGRYPIHTGTNRHLLNGERWGLPTKFKTMANILKKANYSTNLIGKWHLGHSRRELTPTYRGFDYHYGFWGEHIDYFTRMTRDPYKGYDFRRNMHLECGRNDEYVPELLVQEAEKIIHENNNTRPLFLLFSHILVHTPLIPPSKNLSHYFFIKPIQRQKYAAMVNVLDQHVGRIVYALHEAHMLQNSIILFQSDNGAPVLPKADENFGSNHPLRGIKYTPWEGGVRVVGVIWSYLFTGEIKVSSQVMYIADWLPTFATAAGIKLDYGLELDGIDFWYQLTGTNIKPIPREIIHYIDVKAKSFCLTIGALKYMSGPILPENNGYWTYRTGWNFNPDKDRYAHLVMTSKTAIVLGNYKKTCSCLSDSGIKRSRQLFSVYSYKARKEARPCYPTLEPCLFDILGDPLESDNQLKNPIYSKKVSEFEKTIQIYQKLNSMPNAYVGPDSKDVPKWHNCIWDNYEENKVTKGEIVCDPKNVCGKHVANCSCDSIESYNSRRSQIRKSMDDEY